ncbi:MAG: aminotransferase class IV [Candidatus Aphodomorpha sp.]|nr:aminotransferase class IV [bacterium]
MDNIGYYNGVFAPIDELMVPACDRGMYFGDGAYEAIRVEKHVPFAIDEHFDRLYDSLRALRIPFTMPRQELYDILMECARRVDADAIQLYFQVTRGTARRVHAFAPGATPNLMVFAYHYELVDIDVPRKVITLPDQRWDNCWIKSLNLIPGVLASQAALDAGCQDAILHRNGVVTECTAANLLMLKDGVVRTAPADGKIIPGVTRNHFLKLARENGIPVVEEAFTLDEAMEADELLITSTSVHGVRVVEIDGKPVCGRDLALAKRLQTLFRSYFWKSVGQ